MDQTRLYPTGCWHWPLAQLQPGELTVLLLDSPLHPDPWQSGVQMLIDHETASRRTVDYIDHHHEQHHATRLLTTRATIDTTAHGNGCTIHTIAAHPDNTLPGQPHARTDRQTPTRRLLIHDHADTLLHGSPELIRHNLSTLAAHAHARNVVSIVVLHDDTPDWLHDLFRASPQRITVMYQSWEPHTGFEDEAWTDAAVITVRLSDGSLPGGMSVALANDPKHAPSRTTTTEPTDQ